MRSPRNRKLDTTRFAASYPENRASNDTCTRRKRVRFAQGTLHDLETQSDGKAKLSDETPKTSEYAFFKKLRQDASLPVHKGNRRTDEYHSGDSSGDCPNQHGGAGNRISQCFQNLQFSLHAQDLRPADSSLLLSPITSPSKATDTSSLKQRDFRKPEFTHPIKKVAHFDFETSRSPFRDRLRSSVAGYVYGQGNIFSNKRDKLLQLVADTYPESKELNLNGVDLVSSMLDRLFPNGYDSKVLRARKLRQLDSCTPWLPDYPENTADSEKFGLLGYCGSTEVGDLLPLDFGSMPSGSTELAKWSGEFRTSPEHAHYEVENPYNISDYVRSRSLWKKYRLPCLPCETSVCNRSSDLMIDHPDDHPSGQNLLLGWADEKTEGEDQLQITPYKFDYDTYTSLHSNSQSLWKNDYRLGTRIDPSLYRVPPQLTSGHYGIMDDYFKTKKKVHSYVASNHLLEDRENKSWDAIQSPKTGSYFTNKYDDSDLPCMKSHLLHGTPNITTTHELIPFDYPREKIMGIDQPWEICGKGTFSNNCIDDCHRYIDGGYQIGYYTDEPSYVQTTYCYLPFET